MAIDESDEIESHFCLSLFPTQLFSVPVRTFWILYNLALLFFTVYDLTLNEYANSFILAPDKLIWDYSMKV